jgi:hypothetical protein
MTERPHSAGGAPEAAIVALSSRLERSKCAALPSFCCSRLAGAPTPQSHRRAPQGQLAFAATPVGPDDDLITSVMATMEKKPRVFTMSFASVYVLYVQKAEKKGRTKDEVDAVIGWLTGYRGKQLQKAIDAKVDFETFFAKAPQMNPNTSLIKGLVCGVRVEEVADPLMRKIRWLDKLIDELAKGKKMESILRA